MTYRFVTGRRLATSYDDAPSIVPHSASNKPLMLEVTYRAEPVPAPREAWYTKVMFGSVLEYRWVEFDYSFFTANVDDVEFGLIEIQDSGMIKQFLDSIAYPSLPIERRLGALKVADIHHYRICFDDYGCLDVLCVELRIGRFKGVTHQDGPPFPASWEAGTCI